MTITHSPSILVGIDVGGTFTDFVVSDGGELRIYKLPTTPDDQSRAIVDGLKDLGVEAADVVHGMTVATNALLERKGAQTALLTTEGFADVLVLGRQNRPHIYHLYQERPPTLVADPWRLEVAERVTHTGEVARALDEEQVRELAARLATAEIESLAIAFLFSYRNPDHEIRAAELIRATCPDLPLSLSSEILPEYREFERTSTTVINAYVQPLVARYLQRLAQALEHSSVRIMQSNGGAIGLQQAAAQAARVVLSGPAGGVVGAYDVARQAAEVEVGNDPDSGNAGEAEPRIITFDMGGTSTDVALCPGSIPATSESTITDLPLRLPVIDIHTVGAGGGSIALVDAGGALHVGPRSAGAVPGPVCYGRGGLEPTVTDANLVLGRLDPGGFLGGKGAVTLDLDAAQSVMAALGAQLNLTAEEAALGVVRVANATMERALRRVSVERGYDPRLFSMVPFGGAGPLHACELAASLGIRQVLVPPIPGVLSAYGMLVADVVHDSSISVLGDAAHLALNPQPIQKAFEDLQETVRDVLAREGFSRPAVSARLDMRYKGQSYELPVALSLPIDAAALGEAVTAFHAAHARRYGYDMAAEPVEIVTLRVRGRGSAPAPRLPQAPLASADAGAARIGAKDVWFSSDGPTGCACYDRRLLQPGNRFIGPAIVYQFDTTIVVAPGWHAHVDTFANLWMER